MTRRIRYPPAMRRAWPLFLIFFVSACLKPAAPLIPSPKERHDVSPAELEQLTIPPSPDSLEILGRLESQADQGDVSAAWNRTHYLLDLFDAVRFAGDETSRNALSTISARPISAMSGSAATEAIAELLALEVDHVLELDRKHSLAQQAHALIRFDATPPSARSQVFQRIEELKRVVAKGSVLGTAARLRLFGYCRVAMQDARALRGARQRIALSHCLYPLYASDPAPYFSDKAGNRPPPPQLAELLIDMRALLEGTPWPRLASATKAQGAWLNDFKTQSASFSTLNLRDLRLAPANAVTPYDDYPVLGDSKGEIAAEAAKVRGALMSDGRGVLALASPSEARASETVRAAAIAATAGADTLAVLVSMQQRLRVPKGDYGSGRVQDGKVSRIGEIHWSLALMHGFHTAPGTQGAKATSWDPRRAQLRLHLLVAPKTWRLLSDQGELSVIETSTKKRHPRDELREELAKIRRAYPDEDGLVLVADTTTSHGALVAAAQAARVDSAGNALFSRLAIAKSAPSLRSGKALQSRILRRAAAQISVVPESLAKRNPVALRCYQELHNKGRAPAGEIRMELDAQGSIKTSGRGTTLVACAKKAYAGAMLDAKIPSVSVRFSARAK